MTTITNPGEIVLILLLFVGTAATLVVPALRALRRPTHQG